MQLRSYALLMLLVLLLGMGCTEKESLSTQTLLLSLQSDDGRLQVADYKVHDKTFMKSQQQGQYQAHIFDEKGKVIGKFNFEKVKYPSPDNETAPADFQIALPFMPTAQKVEIYQLDGSSGHYQLKTDSPLIIWPLPKDIAEHANALER